MEIKFSKPGGPFGTIVITQGDCKKPVGWIRKTPVGRLLKIDGPPSFVSAGIIRGVGTNYKACRTVAEAKRIARAILMKRGTREEKEAALLLKIQKECAFLSNDAKSKAEIVAKRFAEEKRKLV